MASAALRTPNTIWAKVLEQNAAASKKQERGDSFVFITGARSSGKSTLLNRFLYPDRVGLDMHSRHSLVCEACCLRPGGAPKTLRGPRVHLCQEAGTVRSREEGLGTHLGDRRQPGAGWRDCAARAHLPDVQTGELFAYRRLGGACPKHGWRCRLQQPSS
jgi:hypothetical protein